jgi:hypothetical protein
MFGQICAQSDGVCVTPWHHGTLLLLARHRFVEAPRGECKRKRNMPKPQRRLLRWYESQPLDFHHDIMLPVHGLRTIF